MAQLINALSVFVVTPHHIIARTIAWRDSPLSLGDLLKVKLVGYSKACPLTGTAVERYASVLDFENQLFHGIPYSKGCLLKDFIASKRRWDENTFLAHIQFCLMELGKSVLMHYHTGNQVLTNSQKADYNSVKGSPADHRICPRAIPNSDVIKSLGLNEEDLEIVEVFVFFTYLIAQSLCELLREQQANVVSNDTVIFPLVLDPRRPTTVRRPR